MRAIALFVLIVQTNLTFFAYSKDMNIILTLEIPDTASLISSHNWRLADNLTSKLAYIDSYGQINPFIAKTWKISNDGKTVTFFLNENAKFSDGTSITADDVAFTFKRLILLNYDLHFPIKDLLVNSGNLKNINDPFSGIEIADRHTIKFHLKEYIKEFIFYLSLADSGIIHRNTVDDKLNIINYNVSSGAYFIKEARNNQILLQFNKYFLLANSVSIKQIKLVPRKANNSELATAIKNGEIDLAESWLTINDSIVDLVKTYNLKLLNSNKHVSHYLLINTKNITKKSDRDFIFCNLLKLLDNIPINKNDFQERSKQIIPTILLGSIHDNKEIAKIIKEKTKNVKCLNKGKTYSIDLLNKYSTDSTFGRELNKQIAAQKAPFKINLVDKDVFFKKLKEFTFDVVLMPVSMSERHIDASFKFLISTDIYSGSVLYNELQKIFMNAMVAKNKTKKAQYYREISKALISESVAVPVAFTTSLFVARNNINQKNSNTHDFKLEFWNLYREE